MKFGIPGVDVVRSITLTESSDHVVGQAATL